LAGITPIGALAFTSDVYGGRITDTKLTEVCGFLDLIEEMDCIIADRGFLINDMLNRKGARCLYPNFKFHNQTQFDPDEVLETAQQANLRIHVERAFGRMKTFHWLSKQLKLNQLDLAGSIFHIVAMMTNFYTPLVGMEDTDEMDRLDGSGDVPDDV
jgi:hypothetical protein